MKKQKRTTSAKQKSWRDVRPGEWITDVKVFEGALHVVRDGNLVEVFLPEPYGGGCYRFRRIKGKLIRTG